MREYAFYIVLVSKSQQHNSNWEDLIVVCFENNWNHCTFCSVSSVCQRSVKKVNSGKKKKKHHLDYSEEHLASSKQWQYIQIDLALMPHSLTNWIMVALALCGIAAKMPRRTGWEAEIIECTPTHFLWQSPLILLVLSMSLHCKGWEWEVMAPADWLWGLSKNHTHTHTPTHTLTHNEVFAYDAIIVTKSVKLADSEMHNDPYGS